MSEKKEPTIDEVRQTLNEVQSLFMEEHSSTKEEKDYQAAEAIGFLLKRHDQLCDSLLFFNQVVHDAIVKRGRKSRLSPETVVAFQKAMSDAKPLIISLIKPPQYPPPAKTNPTESKAKFY